MIVKHWSCSILKSWILLMRDNQYNKDFIYKEELKTWKK
jgi:hypothetical protein